MKIRKHAIVEGAIALVMFTLILMAVNVQVENSDDRVSFRLGPEDSTYEIIQELKYGERVDSTIKNLDSNLALEIVYISVEDSAKTMENGSIDWPYIVSLGDHYVLQPGEDIDIITDSYLIYNLIVMHNPSNVSGDVIEVSIVNDYNDNKNVAGNCSLYSFIVDDRFCIVQASKTKGEQALNSRFFTISFMDGRRIVPIMTNLFMGPP